MEKPLVMVVDDDPIDCIIAEKILELTTMISEVVIKNSGREVLGYLKSKQNDNTTLPKHIFIHINMPGMNGFDVLDLLPDILGNEKLPQIKIHLLTSSANRTDKQRAMDNEFVSSYIAKPFNIDKALGALRRSN